MEKNKNKQWNLLYESTVGPISDFWDIIIILEGAKAFYTTQSRKGL